VYLNLTLRSKFWINFYVFSYSDRRRSSTRYKYQIWKTILLSRPILEISKVTYVKGIRAYISDAPLRYLCRVEDHFYRDFSYRDTRWKKIFKEIKKVMNIFTSYRFYGVSYVHPNSDHDPRSGCDDIEPAYLYKKNCLSSHFVLFFSWTIKYIDSAMKLFVDHYS